MTAPYEWIDSPFRCPYDGKRLTAEYGQHERDGELVEVHACMHCGRTWQTKDKALLLPEVREPVKWMTLEQMVELRTRHLDRPEFLRHQPGLREIVEEWADA